MSTELRLRITLFAQARDLAGSAEVELRVPVGSRVAEVRRLLGREYPALQPLLPRLLIAVGTEYADDGQLVAEGAHLACFPPVSGG